MLNIKNKKIGVLMGGWSGEREISLKSGKMVAASLRKQGFNTVEIDVDRNIAETLRKKRVDIAFIALHGNPGEDGTIQGMLEVMGIPYTGSGVLASAICINKLTTKAILKENGLSVPDYFYGEPNPRAIKAKIGLPPWVIKPICEGSSLGIHIIRDISRLEETFLDVKKRYGNVFIEKFIQGMNCTCGILGGKALPILELISKEDFYNYRAKYTKGLTQFIIPARLPEAIYKKTQRDALTAHKVTGCKGFSRVDFVVRNEVSYILEINTIPGLMELSDLPAEAKVAGINYDEVIYTILRSAV